MGRLINYSQTHNHRILARRSAMKTRSKNSSRRDLAAVEQLDPDLYKVDEIIDDIATTTWTRLRRIPQPARTSSSLNATTSSRRLHQAAQERCRAEEGKAAILFSEFADHRPLPRTATHRKPGSPASVEDRWRQQPASSAATSSRRFSPYYNETSSAELIAEQARTEIRILIATDVLSEGLNLQDATRLINYDLHWNPVRLMQRIGRVDRRMNPDIEARIIADHPERKKLRGKTAFWNFLPPEELDELLRLFQRVTNKTLRHLPDASASKAASC
jgi:hypothetical protein